MHHSVSVAGLSCLVGLLLASGGADAADAKSADKRTRQGFTVVAMIATDPDWREKWNTPRETVPEFHGPGVMKVGEKATLLVFFSDARLDGGIARLNCDLTIRDADGSVDEHPAQLCFESPINAPPHTLFMTGLEVGFEVSPNDISGIYEFEIGVTDLNRRVRVPVTVTVEFDTGKGAT
jgi:hypothetical protein